MCELMGMSFARPISADFTIKEFSLRSQENADGWGLAWYPDQAAAMVKEPIPWGGSTFKGFLESYRRLQSLIYIAHVRHRTTSGPPTHADTHPFSRELEGRDYCFAHNGTLTGPFWDLPLGLFHPVGGTDSEFMFCHLLGELAKLSGSQLEEPAAWQWLHKKLRTLNRHGRINCLLSDGCRLFGYHDVNGFKGLTFRKVFLPDPQARHFGDATLTFDLNGEADGGEVNHGFVTATRPMSEKGWLRFEPGELLVFEEGNICFSSHRNLQDLTVFMTSLSAS